MKFTKTAAATTVALGALVAVLAYSTTTIAVAQTPGATPAPAAKAPAPAATPAPAAKAPAPAASAASRAARHAGTYTGQKVDTMTYTPSCPAFTIGMDAAAIQESSSRAFVAAEAARFEGVRDRWDTYEDCLTENGSRDVEIVRTNLGDTLSSATTNEATVFSALNDAAKANIERIGRLPAPRAAKAPRGAPPAAATVPAAPTLSAWTAPTGRFIGSLTGTAAAPVYASGCPDALNAVSATSFAAETTRDGFEKLLAELRAMPDRINQVRTCRGENGQADYEAIQKAVTNGVNAMYLPSSQAFEREYAAVRFQLNEHKKPGGLLAAPEMGRPKAKASPAKTKKKK